MKKAWKALQLIAVIPVAVLSALATMLSFAGIGDALSRWSVRGFWDFAGSMLFAAFLLTPLFAVYCLYVAIMQEPSAIRARPKLTVMVIAGLVAGILLALILVPLEITGENSRFGLWTLSILLPLALAVMHIVRIARARPPDASGVSLAAPPVE